MALNHFIQTPFVFKSVDYKTTEDDRAEALAAGLMIGPRLNCLFVKVSGRQYERVISQLRKLHQTYAEVGLTTDDEDDYGVALGLPSGFDPD